MFRRILSIQSSSKQIYTIIKKLSQNSLTNSSTQTPLFQLYIQRHDINNAYRLFLTITNKSSCIYATMIKGLISNNMLDKVLDLFDEMKIQPSRIILIMLFSVCARINNDRAKQTGRKFLNEMSGDFLNDNILLTAAINMLMKFGDVKNAEDLFQTVKKKDIVTYNAMMKGYTLNKMCDKALDVFEQIQLNLSNVSYTIIFNTCAQLSNDRAKQIGRKLLNEIPEKFNENNYIQNSAIDMLMKFGDVKNAEDLFQIIKKKDIITYGAMMKGYTLNNMHDNVLNLLEQIQVNLSNISYTIIFNACAQLSNDRAKQIGRKLLDEMPKNFKENKYIQSSAIDMLIKFGDVKNAEKLFQIIKKKDIITYNTMLKGYTLNKMCDKALDLFEQIQLNLDDISYTIIFNACAQLSNDRAKQIGRRLLGEMPKNLKENKYIQNSAIDMLMKFGDIKNAEILFKMFEKKDIITYGAMMKGYNINNEPLKSLELFEEMKKNEIKIDKIVSLILIDTCAKIGIRSICESTVNQFPSDLYNNQYICNALISMWGKAGLVKNAQQIFESVDQPDVITYNAMINAYGKNRMGLEAVDLYRKMPNNLRNEISYICILNTCSHSGLLDEAYSIFNEISHKTQQVITTMVDCLSRLFLFDEAKQLIEDYEKCNAPYSVMYMALLSGARNSRQSHLSQEIHKRMQLLFPNEKNHLISASVLLCNISSSLGDHEEAQALRLDRIKEFGNKAKVGLSWTEVNGEVVQFTAHDQSHPRSKEIYAEAQRISTELIKYGHVHDASWITRPLGEHETAESVLCSHSERLAIAFNFIEGRKPSFIQITKNLRVCGDCHQATKLIAKIRQVEIVVRDASCIHHFSTNGTCSCQDHF
ncbi:unnamed protein product [Adineta steineri]|uniref:DYW domain-containing protein n=1 Tax=Adineta steineri TaxID=433720 RepID=A0A816D2C2_9BILA|nr:unnamed protein product [Adineta steineri]CAF1629122.1 unnamed protein product [Adineta steineri]